MKSGKKFFEWLGSVEVNQPRSAKHYQWPLWAQQSYMRGRLLAHRKIEDIEHRFAKIQRHGTMY